MRTLSILAAACLVACDDGGGANKYAATYEVPVSDELANAAIYSIDDVEWVVDGGEARLSYDLPRALVGKTVHVEFTGPIDAGADSAVLSGEAGTANCTIGAEIVCHEEMSGLLPINPDLEVVEQIAKEQQVDPAARVEVAKRFGVDPIGIVSIDVDG